MKLILRDSHYGFFLRALAVVFMTAGVFSSCVTNKKTTYLQDIKDSEISTEAYIQEGYKIRVSDNLFIRVVTPDPRFSEMFNTLPVAAGNVATEQSVDLLSYSVKADGTVDIPYLGSIYVEGKTVSEAKGVLQNVLKEYITDAAITVKLVNNYVSILGEVAQPGLYPIYKEHLNIFQAIAMAGDLDDFSDRTEVSIIRDSPNGSLIKEFNINDRNIVDSEFYYVLPNDVIYLKPMRGKFMGFNAFPYVMILTTVTTFLLILNYLE